jgi:uncharacterized C2H2 Zn-finger protein
MARVKARKYKCPKCDRTFAMPAHLARHQNTTHGAKRTKMVARRKATKRITKRMVRYAGRSAKPATWSQTGPLLLQMQAYRNDLLAQRTQVNSQIDAIDKALAAMGGTIRAPMRKLGRGRRGGRTRPGSLKSHIEGVLRGHTGAMAVKDVTAGVLKSGFTTKNKTLAKSVGVALSQMPNVRRVARGKFRLK